MKNAIIAAAMMLVPVTGNAMDLPEPGVPFEIPVTDARFEVKYPWHVWVETGVSSKGKTSVVGVVDQAVRFYEDPSVQVETFVSVSGSTGSYNDDTVTPAVGLRANFKLDTDRKWTEYGTFTVGVRAERQFNMTANDDDTRVLLYGVWSLGGAW